MGRATWVGSQHRGNHGQKINKVWILMALFWAPVSSYDWRPPAKFSVTLLYIN